MTIRNAEARLPRHFLPLADANRRAVRAFTYGSVIFGLIGFVAGWALS